MTLIVTLLALWCVVSVVGGVLLGLAIAEIMRDSRVR